MTEIKTKTYFDISVVVCCYSGVNTIQMCLNSLLNQKFHNQVSFEVLLIDDGSKDGSENVIKQFLNEYNSESAHSFKYYRKENEGLSIARNYGWQRANSDLITFIDEDAVADEYFLNNVINAFHSHPDVNCVGGDVKILNSDNSMAQLIQNSIFSQFMSREDSVIGTNMSFRKSLLIKHGGFQPEFTYRGDETVFFAISKQDLKIFKSKDISVKHRQIDSKKRFFRARFENGFFGAAEDYLMTSKGENRSLKYRLFINIFNLLAPIFLVSLIFTLHSLVLMLFSLSVLILILLKRFVFNGYILSILNEFKLNIDRKYTVNEFLVILYLVITGRYVADYGYIKGVLKYKKQIWKSNNMDE